MKSETSECRPRRTKSYEKLRLDSGGPPSRRGGGEVNIRDSRSVISWGPNRTTTRRCFIEYQVAVKPP